MTKLRSVPILVLGLVSTLALAGCGPINAGSAGAADFTRYISDEPGVSDVEVSSSNNLPFTGSARATVILEEGSSDDTLVTVVDLMAAYLRDHPGSVSWSMDAELDGFSLGVSPSDDANQATLALAGEVRALDGVVGGGLETSNGDTDYAVVADGTQFITTLAELVKLDFAGAVQARDAAGGFAVTSTDATALPADEIAAFDAVAAVYPVTSAQLAPGVVTLRVGSDDDAVAAAELAQSVPGSPLITFSINGGIVTREGEGDFSLVNAAIERLLDIPGVTAIDATPRTLRIESDSTGALIKSEEVLGAVDPGELLTVHYHSADAATPTFRIWGPTERRGEYIPIVTELLAGGYVDQIEILADRVDIVAGAYDEGRMAKLAATLKAALPAGEQVRLTNSTGGVNFSFVAGEFIEVPSEESYGAVDATGFVDAWNSAP